MQVEVRAQNMELGGQKTGAMEHETWGTVCSMRGTLHCSSPRHSGCAFQYQRQTVQAVALRGISVPTDCGSVALVKGSFN